MYQNYVYADTRMLLVAEKESLATLTQFIYLFVQKTGYASLAIFRLLVDWL